MPKDRDNPGRIPPHNLDAERAILGALLLNPTDTTTRTGPLNPTHFYNPRHRFIAQTIWHLLNHDHPIDPITVADHLNTQGLLTDAGGPTYLNELTDAVPSISAAGTYADIVTDTAVRRELIAAAARITDRAHTADDTVHAIAAATELLNLLDTTDHLDDVSTLDIADIDTLLQGDLDLPDADLLERSDGRLLLYTGAVNVFQAEPESGKTWTGLAAAEQVLEMGGSVAMVDNEATARDILARLLALGAPADALRDRFTYLTFSGPLGPVEMTRLTRHLETVNPDLVIIDSVAASMQLEGLDENINADFYAWLHKVPQPLARTGAAVLLIDHVAKEHEHRGRWARGAGGKLGAVDGAAYLVQPIIPFNRNKAGSSKLIVAKDKPGGVAARGETAAVVSIEPYADGSRVIVSIQAPADHSPGDGWKPTGLMAKVSRELEASPVPLTANRLRDLVQGKRKMVSQAITRLIQEGHVREVTRDRKKVLELLEPYRDPTALTVDQPPPDWQPASLDLDVDAAEPPEDIRAPWDDDPTFIDRY